MFDVWAQAQVTSGCNVSLKGVPQKCVTEFFHQFATKKHDVPARKLKMNSVRNLHR
jgi:hypothetical protein